MGSVSCILMLGEWILFSLRHHCHLELDIVAKFQTLQCELGHLERFERQLPASHFKSHRNTRHGNGAIFAEIDGNAASGISMPVWTLAAAMLAFQGSTAQVSHAIYSFPGPPRLHGLTWAKSPLEGPLVGDRSSNPAKGIKRPYI